MKIILSESKEKVHTGYHSSGNWVSKYGPEQKFIAYEFKLKQWADVTARDVTMQREKHTYQQSFGCP